MTPPRVSYIIASTVRTGSYLLSEGLDATGRAGHPREIFCPERRGMYEGEWQLPEGVVFDDFLRTALVKGMTKNRVFGTKIHRHHLEPLARECKFSGEPSQLLRKLFPGAKYVHLRRRDRRAQAISWYRAKITNEWWRIHGVTPSGLTGAIPEFHAPEIRRKEFELERQEQAWEAFFADASIESITMDYETLAANYRDEVARALAFIGQDPKLVELLPEPRLVVQADATTEERRRKMDALFPLT
jgi:trehalose 2-sulfotransferase